MIYIILRTILLTLDISISLGKMRNDKRDPSRANG